MLTVVQIPVLTDNYVYLLNDSSSGQTAVVDPAVAAPVLAELKRRDWTLHYILNTHHHGDHVGGNLPLKRTTGCEIVGFSEDKHRIPGISIALTEGDVFSLGETRFEILATPGHTIGHCAYYVREAKALFCGDTLFAMGCGRLFEGTPEQMWQSLQKLTNLPEDTRVYCAHEYTLSNARFALSLQPWSITLNNRLTQIEKIRAKNQSTVPTTLAEERRFNPFLTADDAAWPDRLGLSGRSAVEVFARIRQLKDAF